MKKFHTFSVILGIVLLVLLIRHIGFDDLWHELTLLGWGLVPLILIEGIAAAFHALGWRYCLGESHRSIPFHRLFQIHMSGFAIDHLTPTATVGGEVTKWALLSTNRTGTEAATGIIIGKLSYSLAQLLFVAMGSILTLWMFPLPPGLWPAMLIGSALLAAGMIAFLLIQRAGKLGVVVRLLASYRLGGSIVEKASQHISQVDDGLKTFYATRPGDLPLSLFWHIMGFLCGIAQSWYFLVILTDHGTLPVAAGIWFLGSWFDLLTFAIPLGLGVQEGTRVLAFKAVGFGMATGLAYGVMLRLEQIFWSSFGLLAYTMLLSQGGKGERLSPHRSVGEAGYE